MISILAFLDEMSNDIMVAIGSSSVNVFQPDLLVRPTRTGVWLVAQPVQHRLALPGAGAPRFLVWSSGDNDTWLGLNCAAGRYAGGEPVPRLSLLCLLVCVSEQPDRRRCVCDNRRGPTGFPVPPTFCPHALLALFHRSCDIS